MKTIQVSSVTEIVRQAVQTINFVTPAGTLARLKEAQIIEPSPAGRQAMTDIVENRAIAAQQRVPMCQDTGMVLVFVEIGQEVHLAGGILSEAISEGVRLGYREGYLRKSVVREPLFDRQNTGDNTPPVIHYDLVPGDQLKLTIAAKGFGAENMSRLKILTPAQGIAEVKRQVVQCVVDAGPNACPPVVVGVGIGGTLEMAALLAKKAIMREMGQPHSDARYAALEEELLTLVNATGIGPQGWGGRNTALEVRVEYFPTHIASLPLAINLDCHLHRHITIMVE
jgi:fumarate hydratase subunit alpha